MIRIIVSSIFESVHTLKMSQYDKLESSLCGSQLAEPWTYSTRLFKCITTRYDLNYRQRRLQRNIFVIQYIYNLAVQP